MNTAKNKITATDYKIYKQLLHKPSDDKVLYASIGLPVKTAREIRLSRNYLDYKRRIKEKRKYESLLAKTKLSFVETPRQKQDRGISDRLDQQAEKTSRFVGWMGLAIILLLTSLVILGIVKTISSLTVCR